MKRKREADVGYTIMLRTSVGSGFVEFDVLYTSDGAVVQNIEGLDDSPDFLVTPIIELINAIREFTDNLETALYIITLFMRLYPGLIQFYLYRRLPEDMLTIED